MNKPTSTYQSGRCTIHTYSANYHELYYDGVWVSNFSTFRAAVTYQMQEFQ